MEINLDEIPFGIDFHPSCSLVAAAIISGNIDVYKYDEADLSHKRLFDVNAHSESCRALRFNHNGEVILSVSSDRSILATNVETGSPIVRLENAHEDSISSLINISESTVATGDDQGCIKVWDTRQRTCCNSFNAHDDYVSDLTFTPDSMKLLAASGDGTLSVCNIRSNKVQTRSEFSEEDLLSIVIMKNGRKVVCGSQSGTLLLYSWGFFKDCSDRFTGLTPNSVDALLKLDEDRLITGTENGLISLINILPNQIVCPLAEHSEYPIERLAMSHDRKCLGSISHDRTLKLWDLEDLLQNSNQTQHTSNDSDGNDDTTIMEVDTNPPKPGKGNKSRSNSNRMDNNFFADL